MLPCGYVVLMMMAVWLLKSCRTCGFALVIKTPLMTNASGVNGATFAFGDDLGGG